MGLFCFNCEFSKTLKGGYGFPIVSPNDIIHLIIERHDPTKFELNQEIFNRMCTYLHNPQDTHIYIIFNDPPKRVQKVLGMAKNFYRVPGLKSYSSCYAYGLLFPKKFSNNLC